MCENCIEYSVYLDIIDAVTQSDSLCTWTAFSGKVGQNFKLTGHLSETAHWQCFPCRATKLIKFGWMNNNHELNWLNTFANKMCPRVDSSFFLLSKEVQIESGFLPDSVCSLYSCTFILSSIHCALMTCRMSPERKLRPWLGKPLSFDR